MRIEYDKIKFVEAETEPALCNNGNVTLRHTGFLGKQEKIESYGWERGGEKKKLQK